MPTKVYQHDESAITWQSASGTELLTPTSLASGAGRQGAYHDFGTSARARRFNARARIVPGGTRVVGEVIDIYFITSDGNHPDNDDGTGDIAVSSIDKLRNLTPIGQIQIDENAAVKMVWSGDVEISARYGAPLFWNRTANTLSATATDYGFQLTPVPDEIQ